MLKFALKNMGVKKVQIILIVVSIIISASVGVLAFNVSSQVSDGITNNAGYYSLIVGPSGSKTQLAMNTMYFTDEPLGTIPYDLVTEFERNPDVRQVIPYAMADNYNGSSVVGTTSKLLEDKALAQGTMFSDPKAGTEFKCQAVVGARVAAENNLKIGDEIFTSHSAAENSKHDKGIVVVGILEETYTSFDKVVFTQLKTLWDMHEHSETEEDTTEDFGHGHAPMEDENQETDNNHETEEEHGHENDGEEGEEHEHSHLQNTVCAILINTTNPSSALSLVTEYDGKTVNHDGKTYTLQAIEPMDAVRDVLNDADSTKYIVFVLCAIILIMNIIVISIITLLNMYHSAKEISLMRLIGISMRKINLLYIIQNGIIGLVSTLIAFGVSRLCLLLMGDYVASMGVVLNMGKIYPLEILILAGIFLISVIPTVICTFVMAKRDSLAE